LLAGQGTSGYPFFFFFQGAAPTRSSRHFQLFYKFPRRNLAPLLLFVGVKVSWSIGRFGNRIGTLEGHCQQKAAAVTSRVLLKRYDPFSAEYSGRSATPTQSFGGRRRIDHQ